MTLRVSTGFTNFLQSGGSISEAFKGGELQFRSGSQPSSADAAPTGTLLATITDNSGARTAETQATGTVTLTGAAGSIDTLTVDGVAIIDAAVPFNTSLTQTAVDLAYAINTAMTFPQYTASAASTVVTIKARRGAGAAVNAFVVVSGTTTMTGTDVDMSGGVTAVNGLKFDIPAAGVMDKLAAQTWEGVGLVAGVAGWFRLVGSVVDSGAVDSDGVQIRMDGAIASSGSDLDKTNTDVEVGAKQTQSKFQITVLKS